MTGAIVFYNSNKQTRLDKIKTYVENTLELEYKGANPDMLIIKREENKSSISIGIIKGLNKFTNQTPISYNKKVVIIYDAQALTAPAQNALLKTLEETPSYVTIILETKRLKSLLDTVVSRCRRIRVEDSGDINDSNIYQTLINDIDAMELAYELSKEDKQDIISKLEEYILSAREYLILNPSSKVVDNINLIQDTKESIENTNISTKLALERMFLSIYNSK